MSVVTPQDIRAAADTLSQFTSYLRDAPDLAEALSLAEPLLDEDTGIPVQLGDTLRALARVLESHLGPSCPPRIFHLVNDLREAGWAQSDQHMLHYVLDAVSTQLAAAPSAPPKCDRCR